MFFYTALLTAATLAAGALAALPTAGRYYIVNQETSRRFDVEGFHTAPRTPVLGYPPNEGDNQKWDIVQESTEGESGFYTFTAVSPVRKAFVNAQNVGNGVMSETFGATFNRGWDRDGFHVSHTVPFRPISVPLTNALLAVTTTTNATQLTLEPRDTTNNLQVWSFQVVVE